MWLSQLTLLNFRNLKALYLSACHPNFNLICGLNGSGKTSVLEAIHVLGMARSFRTVHAAELIASQSTSLVVRGLLQTEEGPVKLAVERTHLGDLNLRLRDQSINNATELVKTMPLQVLNAHTFELLEAGPFGRRQYLDGGVFYVEPSFHRVWQLYKRILKQRNAFLKTSRRTNLDELRIWDSELVRLGGLLDEAREKFVIALRPYLSVMSEDFIEEHSILMTYQRGWSAETDLQSALDKTLRRDQALGYTSQGPHRAELLFTTGGVPIKSILSRGQLKRFFSAMLLARGLFLQESLNLNSIFLIDDLNAELDDIGAGLILEKLRTLQVQTFITAITSQSLEALLTPDERVLFHLSKGQLQAMH